MDRMMGGESLKKLQNENKMCNDCMKNFLSEASKR